MTAETTRQNRRARLFTSPATRLGHFLMLGALVVCAISVAAPCAAQEDGVDPPTPTNTGPTDNGRGPLFAPSAWFVLNTPLQKQVALKLYGFYIGNLDVPVAQIDLPIRATKFLTITPSYMYYTVPASGLNSLTRQPGRFTDSYDEQQFRIDATVGFAIRKLEMSIRNMYVRRFRPAPADDSDRYRGRIAIAYPISVRERVVKPFASYETFYERSGAGWNRQRVWSGVTLPLTKRLSLQPSYLWERSDGSRDIHYALVGLIFNTR